jgi:riboflavin kinase/FMN adenylyltransferase
VKLFRKLDSFPAELRGGALAIGNFDGVHLGHQRIIARLKDHASRLKAVAIVFTFDPHPAHILRPEQSPPPLTWIDRKADLLADLGIDAVVAYPTDLALLGLSYRDFFQKIVLGRIGARAIVEGPNFFFGHDREGNTDRLRELCAEHQVEMEIVAPSLAGEELVSSSRIRQLVGAGDVRAARLLLTQPYRIRGLVVHGAARGMQLGFPTANLDAIDTLIPAFGVYAGRVSIDRRWHWTAIHIGPNSTFKEEIPKVEIHILDYEGSLYGQVLEVDFVERLRDTCAFPTVTELLAQLNMDIDQTRRISREF